MWVKLWFPEGSKWVILLVFLSILNAVSATVAEKDMQLTANEKEALSQFKEKVDRFLNLDFMKTDFYLVRWLRAKNLNVPQAETMLLQHLRWRHVNNIDTILKEDWSDMETDYPYTMDTINLELMPIGTVDIYEWDIRRAVLQGKTHRLLRYLYRLLEEITGNIFEAQAKGQNVTRFVILGNADGFNVVQHACPLCLPSWVQFVRTFEAQYPGFLDEIIVVEATSTVNVVIDLIRPIISPATRNALKVFGQNREKWMTYLDTKISRDQRRPQYGGTKSN
ncbi:SEC14-like protein 2 [Orchesella cincta]|uniref:SEC14-like protein 2 n=1 Tax=Orchesella cincta TaxID=48709 RepID=A0A1D2M7F5_ORCCI|nr:SEC14-like protein 2 [Orchesella cincta]